MSVVFLCLVLAALWINLAGAGLAALPFVRHYAVARVAGPVALCLVGFSFEHFWGLGPRPPLLPLTTAVSLWLVWRHRADLRAHWRTEAVLAAGFGYALAWRRAFPNIDMYGEKMPNLAMIEAYMRGTRLPAPDIWLPPFRLNFYYSFQHYGASLLGRVLGVGPSVSYHLGYCVLTAFIVVLCVSCVAQLCPWRPGRWMAVAALLFGGSGAAIAAHALMNRAFLLDDVRFLGGAIVQNRTNALGKAVAGWITRQGTQPLDLPMEPMGYILVNGDYHPPLSGYVLLALAAAIIAAQASAAGGARRGALDFVLGATVPLALIANAWIFPLQAILVGGWILFRALRADRGYLLPALAGAAAVSILAYPHLIEFAQQSISSNASIGLTARGDHTPVLGWLITFWPVAGILALGLRNRDNRPLALFLVGVWCAELAFTEFYYNHDVYGGPWVRFNTTLKWWGWVYAGIVLTVGALNLASRSRLCRWGTFALLAPTLAMAYDIGYDFSRADAKMAGHFEGYRWINDPVIRDFVGVLSGRPDGIAIQSGLAMANTEAPAVALFAGKMSFIGWPWHETTWRGDFGDIRERFHQNQAFFEGAIDDPLRWLLNNRVRYVIWLPRDNANSNANFKPIDDKIRSHYLWHHLWGSGLTYQIGFWERVDEIPEPKP